MEELIRKTIQSMTDVNYFFDSSQLMNKWALTGEGLYAAVAVLSMHESLSEFAENAFKPAGGPEGRGGWRRVRHFCGRDIQGSTG